jgi:hypothetical protein
MERIPVAGPWITEKEIAYVTDAVKTAWYGEANTYQRRFEEAFGNYVSRRYAIALPSATSAIHLALAGFGLGPGDEVIVPDATWIATSAPISYPGIRRHRRTLLVHQPGVARGVDHAKNQGGDPRQPLRWDAGHGRRAGDRQAAWPPRHRGRCGVGGGRVPAAASRQLR